MKKVVYIAGPISGKANYKETFEAAAQNLEDLGHIPLSPAKLPDGMTKAQYMRINFAQIDAADIVYFLPGWQDSPGARLERAYCEYIGKDVI